LDLHIDDISDSELVLELKAEIVYISFGVLYASVLNRDSVVLKGIIYPFDKNPA
jgi:hypothetical protein